MKKFGKIFASFFTMIIVICISAGCEKSEDNNMPVVSTEAAGQITGTSAWSGGNVTDDKGLEVTARGVCWGLQHSPDINGNKTMDGTGMGSFISSLTGLTTNTPYYVRAYATNSAGTAYGNEISFTTAAMVKYMTAKVDGVSFSAATINVSYIWDQVGISGMNSSNILNIILPEVIQVGSYDLTMLGDFYAQYTMAGSSIYTSQSGTITVVEYNTESKRLKCTFNFVGILAGGSDTITVTEGEFEVTI